MLTNRNELFTNAFKPFPGNIIHIDVVYDKIYLDIFYKLLIVIVYPNYIQYIKAGNTTFATYS